jgi:PAS domain S-box-containing protein
MAGKEFLVMKPSTQPQSSPPSELRTQDSATAVSNTDGPVDPRFRLAFERSPLGMAIIGLDYKLQRANNALCLAVGYSESELMSENYLSITHPDDVEKGRDLATELVRGDIPSYRIEKRYISKNGSVAWLDVTAVLIRDDDHAPQYVLVMIDNITARKRSTEALRTSEERYRSFVVNSSEAIWRFEIEEPIDITLSTDEQIALFFKHTYLAECNDAMARIYGFTHAAEIVGSRFGDLTLTSNPTNISALRKFITQHYRLTEVETTALAADGSTRYIVNNAIGIVIQGMLLRIWGTQRDETDRKRAEQELKASHAQLRSLAGRLQKIREQERSDIAREMHDVLGQSLTSLKIDLFWLRKKLVQSDHGSLNPAIETRIEEMVDGLEKTIVAVKTLSTELRPGILDKLGLAAAVEWQCQEFENRSGIKCACHVPNRQITVNDDRATALFRILQEALSNVIRHSEATAVNVELHRGKSDLTLSISDNGRGITSDEISDPTSLGLLGMRERAEFLGGHFTIKQNATSGSTAVAKVPLIEPATNIVNVSDDKNTSG